MARALHPTLPNFFVMPDPSKPKGILLFPTYWDAKKAHDEMPGSMLGRLNYHQDGER